MEAKVIVMLEQQVIQEHMKFKNTKEESMQKERVRQSDAPQVLHEDFDK